MIKIVLQNQQHRNSFSHNVSSSPNISSLVCSSCDPVILRMNRKAHFPSSSRPRGILNSERFRSLEGLEEASCYHTHQHCTNDVNNSGDVTTSTCTDCGLPKIDNALPILCLLDRKFCASIDLRGWYVGSNVFLHCRFASRSCILSREMWNRNIVASVN